MKITIKPLPKKEDPIIDFKSCNFYLIESKYCSNYKYIVYVPVEGDILFFDTDYDINHLDRISTLNDFKILENITDRINIVISY